MSNTEPILEQITHAPDLRGKRVLLLIPAVTYRATDFLIAANRLGLDLVVGSDGALVLGGRPVVRVDAGDLEGSIDRLISTVGPLDSVVAVDAQMLVLAAKLAARLGRQHNPVDAVVAAGDKLQQRQLWATAGVPQPAFRVISGDATPDVMATVAARLGFPSVIKAISLSGSRGVLRADDEAAVVVAVIEIRKILREAQRPDHQPILIEEYVSGWELSIDGLLTDGHLTVTAIFDKPEMPDGPTFEETLLVTPSRLPTRIISAAVATAERAAISLGLRYGPIHAEIRLDDRNREQKLLMLELAARSIGGLCSRVLRFADGVSLEEMILMNSLGCRITRVRHAGAAGVLMLPVECEGILNGIEGRGQALAVPGITGVSITIPLGQFIRPLPWGDRYLGFIFAEGEEVSVVENALRAARQRLRPIIQPKPCRL
jgi:biotin carboxylase